MSGALPCTGSKSEPRPGWISPPPTIPRDLVGLCLLEDGAGAGVAALGVRGKNREAQLAAAFALERREAVVHQDAGAQVDVEIQLEAHGQQDAFGVLVAGHSRVADRPEVDGGELAPQRVHEARREDGAVLQVWLGAEVEPLALQREAQRPEKADSLAAD